MAKTNDLKDGTRIQSACGWKGTIKDNRKGNTRLAEVEGFFTEIGSVYSHDIVSAIVDGQWVQVEHTPAQLKLKKQLTSMGL
jgi:hypothetical protein